MSQDELDVRSSHFELHQLIQQKIDVASTPVHLKALSVELSIFHCVWNCKHKCGGTKKG